MNKALALAIFLAATVIAPIVLAGPIEEFGQAVFSEVERRLIRDYYYEKYGAIDHDRHDGYRDRDHDRNGNDRKNKKRKGKHKGGPGNPQGLPPGITKKLARGGSLPPGIAKKNLPADLDSRLPPRTDGYERMEVDGQVVLVEAATNTIVDIIRRAELLDASARSDHQSAPMTKPQPKTDLPRNDTREIDRRDMPKPEKPVERDRSWWQFWKD